MSSHCHGSRYRARFRRRARDDRGAVLVEFVLILPVFLLLLFGGIDVSIAVNSASSFTAGVSQGANLIAAGNSVNSGPCIAMIEAENTVDPATPGTAQALCEVTNAIGTSAGADLSRLQLALVCENATGFVTDCTTSGAASFVVCTKAPAQSATGLTSFILNHVWLGGAGYGPLTGTASTTWNGTATTPGNPNGYNSTDGATSNALVCPPAAATYTVTYSTLNSDGISSSTGRPPTDTSSPYTAGVPVTVLPGTSLSYGTETFTGWCTTHDGTDTPLGMTCGTGTTYTAGQTFPMPATDVTLYPMWQ